MRRGTPQQNTQNSPQQGQRRNQSRDRGSYASLGGYQGGNRDASGNAWANRAPPPGQPAAIVDEHVPVRGFNSREVSEYLNRGMHLAIRPPSPPQPLRLSGFCDPGFLGPVFPLPTLYCDVDHVPDYALRSTSLPQNKGGPYIG